MHLKMERRCVACREPKQQSELLRVCRLDGEYILDHSHKLGGRGAYVCKTKECLMKAINKRLFNRAFKTNIPAELYDKLSEYEQNN